MSQYTRTASAEADITEIYLYLLRLSPAAADRVSDGIDATCRRLARSPTLGKVRTDLAPGLRSRVAREGYVIYYVPTAYGIEVQRVIHGRRHIDPSMFVV